MKIKHFTVITLPLIALLFLTSCNLEPVAEESFYLKYHRTGGFAGTSDKFEIFENRDVIYRNDSYSYKTQIDEANLLEIYQTIMNNNFLGLNDDYSTPACDDFSYTITYVSETDSQTVTTNGFALQYAVGSWKRRFVNVMKAIRTYRATLNMNIDSGYVTIARDYPLVVWPYSDQFKLSEHCDSASTVSNDIYSYIQNYDNRTERYFYREDDQIYHIYMEDNHVVNIYATAQLIYWPFDPPLSQITESGLGLTGDDYIWLDEMINTEVYSPKYFYDTLSGDETRIYVLWLRQGNYFE